MVREVCPARGSGARGRVCSLNVLLMRAPAETPTREMRRQRRARRPLRSTVIRVVRVRGRGRGRGRVRVRVRVRESKPLCAAFNS